jgi:hypothetical protein
MFSLPEPLFGSPCAMSRQIDSTPSARSFGKSASRLTSDKDGFDFGSDGLDEDDPFTVGDDSDTDGRRDKLDLSDLIQDIC